MVRIQVQLTADQGAAPRALSARADRSIAALVRDAVDHELEQRSGGHGWERAMGAIGAFESGSSDVSEKHDRDLSEAFAGRFR